MRKIKKGDTVVVVAGKDKGRTGSILRVLKSKRSAQGEFVIVEGANLVKRHTKPVPAEQKPGGIVEKEAPIHISNVAILNPQSNKADGVKFKLVNDKKVRVFQSNGEVIDA